MSQPETVKSPSGDDTGDKLSFFSLLNRLTLAEANNVRKGLGWFVLRVACVVGIAFGFNYYWDNLLPAKLLAVAAVPVLVYSWLNPRFLFAVFGLGGTWGLLQKIFTEKKLESEFGKIFKLYQTVFLWILVVISVALAVIGIIPLGNHFTDVLRVLSGLVVIWVFLWKWPSKFLGDLGKKTVYWTAVVVVITSIALFIPGSFWVKFTGQDPNLLIPSSYEEAVYKLGQTEREVTDKERAKEVARVTEKISRHEPLTEAEKQIEREAMKSTLRPEEKKVREAAQAARAPRGQFAETITVLPGKRAYIPVREGYTAFYECDDWGNVEVPGSRMLSKGCGPRPSRPSDQWGKISGAVLTFTTAYNRPLHVTVTQIPVKY